MATLLDTDVVIHLLDGDVWVRERLREIDAPLLISAMTRIELENGVWRDPAHAGTRRINLERFLSDVLVLDFTFPEIEAYRRILSHAGYSRRKVADRMTAASAIVQGCALATFNGADFRDIPGLQLIDWDLPDPFA